MPWPFEDNKVLSLVTASLNGNDVLGLTLCQTTFKEKMVLIPQIIERNQRQSDRQVEG